MNPYKKVLVDWRDARSIQKAERLKLRLENAGYSLVDFRTGFTHSVLTYVNPEKVTHSHSKK